MIHDYEIIVWTRNHPDGVSLTVSEYCLVNTLNIIAGNNDVYKIQVYDGLTDDLVSKDDILSQNDELHCCLLNKWKGHID